MGDINNKPVSMMNEIRFISISCYKKGFPSPNLNYRIKNNVIQGKSLEFAIIMNYSLRMMKKALIFIVFFTITTAIFAQVREDILVHVLPVTGTPEQANFFKENFEMEITGGGYTITQNPADADYLFQLNVRPNMIVYEDGAEEQAPADEGLFLLHLTLIRAEDSTDIVSFSFPFTELNEMYDFNLKLVYEAMANVPITRLGDIEIIDESDAWRNKWIYLRASGDFIISVYELRSRVPIYNNSKPDDPPVEILNNQIGTFPGITVGLELQFLNFMSIEAAFVARFGEPYNDAAFIPGLQLQLKFPIKLAKHYMLEPYIAGGANANTSDAAWEFPRWDAGGGFQFGIKAGDRGALVIDASYMYSFTPVAMKNPKGDSYNPDRIEYTRHVISIGIGYKIGFFDRPRKTVEDKDEEEEE
jgi:hypothetical protein